MIYRIIKLRKIVARNISKRLAISEFIHSDIIFIGKGVNVKELFLIF